jgi:hypothetical protein
MPAWAVRGSPGSHVRRSPAGKQPERQTLSDVKVGSASLGRRSSRLLGDHACHEASGDLTPHGEGDCVSGGDLWSGQGRHYARWMRGYTRRPSIFLGVVGALAVLALVFLYPAQAEDAPGACAALERRAVQTVVSGRIPTSARAALSGVSSSVLNGQFAAPLSQARYGFLPAPMGCSLTYWRLLLDPSEALPIVGVTRR